jgi:hypothetical protein
MWKRAVYPQPGASPPPLARFGFFSGAIPDLPPTACASHIPQAAGLWVFCGVEVNSLDLFSRVIPARWRFFAATAEVPPTFISPSPLPSCSPSSPPPFLLYSPSFVPLCSDLLSWSPILFSSIFSSPMQSCSPRWSCCSPLLPSPPFLWPTLPDLLLRSISRFLPPFYSSSQSVSFYARSTRFSFFLAVYFHP